MEVYNSILRKKIRVTIPKTMYKLVYQQIRENVTLLK